jgi:dihydroneopterin aldolase
VTQDLIEVEGLRLWSHVGVLEQERRDGQWFELDFSLGIDLLEAGRGDDLAASLDYSVGIRALQTLSRTVRCLTIEHYSEQILDQLERCYGPVPIRLRLSKCRAPIPGFGGRVSVRRQRRWR